MDKKEKITKGKKKKKMGKREKLVRLLNEAVQSERLTLELTISSPAIKCFYVTPAEEKGENCPQTIKEPLDDDSRTNNEALIHAEDITAEESQEELTVKELKQKQKDDIKAIKQQKKEEEYEKKRFTQARREAHKRGYDTGLLHQLDDPEDLYDLSNEEIDRIEAAGYINQDGFYNFVYPDDIGTCEKKKLSKQKIRLVVLLGVVFIGLIVLLFRNIYALF